MLEKIVLCFILTNKLFLGSLFLISNEGISIQKIPEREIFNISENFKSLKGNEENEDFKQFLDFLASKGMGLLTLVEGIALYFIWTLAKDTKSREEILENVFEIFKEKNLDVKQIGQLFRLCGLNVGGFSDLSLRDIENYLNDGKRVVILYHKNRDLVFLLIKKIDFDKGVFCLENQLILNNKKTDEISFLELDKNLIFNGFVFFNEDTKFKP